MDNSNQPEDSNITSTSSKLQLLKGDKGLRVFIWTSLAIALGAALYAFWYTNVREEPIFTVGDEEFRESDIEEYVDLAAGFGINEDYALEGIEQAKIFILTAEEFGVEVDDDAIRQALEERTSYDPELIDMENDWLRLVGERLALEEKIWQGLSSAVQGYSFGFEFSTYVSDFPEDSADVPPEEIGLDPELFRDEDRISQDRDYARERAEHYRQQLQDNNKQPEEIRQAIMEDERLHHLYIPLEDSDLTTRFGYDEELELQQQVSTSVYDFLRTYDGGTGQPSAIQVGERQYSSADDRSGTAEFYYFFVYLEKYDKSWLELEEVINERQVEVLP